MGLLPGNRQHALESQKRRKPAVPDWRQHDRIDAVRDARWTGLLPGHRRQTLEGFVQPAHVKDTSSNFPGRYRRRAGVRYDSIADGNGPIGRKDQGRGTRRFRQILRAAARRREDHDATSEWKRDDGRRELRPASEYHARWRATMRRILRADSRPLL